MDLVRSLATRGSTEAIVLYYKTLFFLQKLEGTQSTKLETFECYNVTPTER